MQQPARSPFSLPHPGPLLNSLFTFCLKNCMQYEYKGFQNKRKTSS